MPHFLALKRGCWSVDEKFRIIEVKSLIFLTPSPLKTYEKTKFLINAKMRKSSLLCDLIGCDILFHHVAITQVVKYCRDQYCSVNSATLCGICVTCGIHYIVPHFVVFWKKCFLDSAFSFHSNQYCSVNSATLCGICGTCGTHYIVPHFVAFWKNLWNHKWIN